MEKGPLLRLAWTAMAVCVLLLGGCGGGSSDETHGPVVRITERDFEIKAPKRIPAGAVQFVVDNKGPNDHELMIARKGKGDLPFSYGGINLSEERLEPLEVDELEPAEPGVRTLDLDLRPGRYILLCNMTGHYLGGMHTEVLARH